MIVDANVLLYAADRSSHHHQSARAWLEDALNGTERVGMPWVSLLAFQRISTHPRAQRAPASPVQSLALVEQWLSADLVWIPEPGPKYAQILRTLIVDGDLRGNLVADAYLAALAIEFGTGICSFDCDFARFPGVNWINPARN